MWRPLWVWAQMIEKTSGLARLSPMGKCIQSGFALGSPCFLEFLVGCVAGRSQSCERQSLGGGQILIQNPSSFTS